MPLVLVILACSQAGRVGAVPTVPAPTDLQDEVTLDSASLDTGSPPPIVWSEVAAGYSNSCGRLSDGRALCWGDNLNGILQTPATRFSQISVGNEYACGILEDGKISCWGCQETNHTRTCTASPSGAFASIDAGDWHACAQDFAGAIRCWGLATAVPGPEFYSENVSDYSTSEYGTCYLEPDELLPVCAGGIGFTEEGSPAHVPDPPAGVQFVQVEAGQNHVCGLKADGHAECWGESTGPGVPVVPAPPDEVFSMIDGCAFETCGLRAEDGHAVCWGPNHLGNPDQAGYVAPPTVPLESLSVGEYHACGVVPGGGEILCWGMNREGDTEPPTLAAAIAILDAQAQ